MDLDPQHAYEHLVTMYTGVPGFLHLCRSGEPKHWVGRRFTIDEAGFTNAVNYAIELDRHRPVGIYLRATTLLSLTGRGRGVDTDTCAVPYLFADLDYGSEGHAGEHLPPTADAAFGLVAEAGLPEPTRWIHSGGGWYPLWALSDGTPVDVAERALQGVQQAIERASKVHGWSYGDVGDLPRPLRLPGSVNRKTAHERRCEVVVP